MGCQITQESFRKVLFQALGCRFQARGVTCFSNHTRGTCGGDGSARRSREDGHKVGLV